MPAVSPKDRLASLDRAGESYIVTVALVNGASFTNYDVLSHSGDWLWVQKTEDGGDPVAIAWQHIVTIKIHNI